MIQLSFKFLIKDFTGFDAVGLRLKEENDYPYYISRGFPADFLEAENYLCARDEKGEIVRDSTGLVVLDCMCGNFLNGKIDLSLSFFTQGGSFRTNNTTRLLASTSEEDRQARTRNRCIVRKNLQAPVSGWRMYTV